MVILHPQFSTSVVAVGQQDTNGDLSWIGTGFIYGYRSGADSKEGVAYVVSNRHVLYNRKNLVVRCSNPPGQAPKIFPVCEAGVVPHPNDKVDVAVVPFPFHKIRDLGCDPAFTDSQAAATIDEMRTGGVTEGDIVHVIGFPLGLVIETHAPIVRLGCIARIRDLYHDHQEPAPFYLDASVFPGNSGGPVIVSPESRSVTRELRKMVTLIGIVSGYVPYTEEAVSLQTGKLRISFSENSGIAIVWPVDYINQTCREQIRQAK